MKKKLKPFMDPTVPDKDNPEWTREDFRTAITFDKLPADMQKVLRGRPRIVQPKEHITIRLSADVLHSFRSKGAGWQTRIDAALKSWLKHNKQA